MMQLPDSLEDAIIQAQAAAQRAIDAGYKRLSVELLFPELKAMPVAEQFAQAFQDRGAGVKVFFTDSGSAAWAQNNWQQPNVRFGSIDVAGTRQTTTVEEQIAADDQLYIFVAPSAVEVAPVEQICDAAGDRPVILLNPRLEDVATIGIGYAGRQLRDRFLSTIEPCYYLRPMEDTLALTKSYPEPWQLWLEQAGTWQTIAEERDRPDSERINAILMGISGSDKPKAKGIFAELGEFLRALSR
jgi:hypothetical protein